MATPRYNRARDFALLLKNLSSFSDNQARVVNYDEDQLEWVDVEIRPNGGMYKGRSFLLRYGSNAWLKWRKLTLVLFIVILDCPHLWRVGGMSSAT